MTPPSVHVSVAVLVMAIALSGCARKTAEAPPQAMAAPPAAEPAPAPTPEPEPIAPEPVAEAPAEFQPAFFGYDSWALSGDARGALDQDAGVLRSQPELAVVIEGHCDERGTIEYNQTLGERRAKAARDYLVAAGVDPARIQTISYGKERPFAEGQDESAWSQNRRAHVVLR